jgi:hypothetical protein
MKFTTLFVIVALDRFKKDAQRQRIHEEAQYKENMVNKVYSVVLVMISFFIYQYLFFAARI